MLDACNTDKKALILLHRITLQHRSRLLRTNPRRYFIASGVSLLIMYSKFTIPPLVEIRPVIT